MAGNSSKHVQQRQHEASSKQQQTVAVPAQLSCWPNEDDSSTSLTQKKLSTIAHLSIRHFETIMAHEVDDLQGQVQWDS